jgi:hypothetical protein
MISHEAVSYVSEPEARHDASTPVTFRYIETWRWSPPRPRAGPITDSRIRRVPRQVRDVDQAAWATRQTLNLDQPVDRLVQQSTC